MRWLNPSATLNFWKPSMAVEMDKHRVLRFIEKTSVYGKVSTAVRWVNEKPEYIVPWFSLSSGEWIRTTDLRVMSPTSYRCSTPHQVPVFYPKQAGSSRLVQKYSAIKVYSSCSCRPEVGYVNTSFSAAWPPRMIHRKVLPKVSRIVPARIPTIIPPRPGVFNNQ